MANKTDPRSHASGIRFIATFLSAHESYKAVQLVLQSEECLKIAYILTYENHHCILFENDFGEMIAVNSGFASGYGGAGHAAFSRSLAAIKFHHLEINEILIPEKLFQKFQAGLLSGNEWKRIERLKKIKHATYVDYMLDGHHAYSDDYYPWHEFEPILPFGLIDQRISDLAKSFSKNPDEAILKGFRRLEDILRLRTSLKSSSQGLVRECFLNKKPMLTWKNIEAGEITGLANLFMGAFAAYRNPRAHSEIIKNRDSLVREFMILNHLFCLEASTVPTEHNDTPAPPEGKLDKLLWSYKTDEPRERGT